MAKIKTLFKARCVFVHDWTTRRKLQMNNFLTLTFFRTNFASI